VELDDEFSNMDEDTWEAMNDEFGDYDMPYRLGALFAAACCMDEEFSEEEQKTVCKFLKKILELFNYDMRAKDVLENCMDLASEGDFLEETIEILGRYLSQGALAQVAADLYAAAGADGLDEEESEFIDAVIEAWCDEDFDPNEYMDDADDGWDEEEDWEDDDDDEEDWEDDDDEDDWDDDDDDDDDEDWDDDDDDDDDDEDDEDDWDDDDEDDDDDDDDEDWDDDDDDDEDDRRGRGRNRRR